MATGFAGFALVFTYFLAVAASVPIALASVVVAWRLHSFPLALAYVLAGAGGLAGLGVVALAVVVDVGAAIGFAASLLVAAVWAVALPLGIGRELVRRYTPAPPAVALRWVTLSWPVAMVASVVWFVLASPGAIGRYNLTFLDGPLFVFAVVVFLAIVWGGPGAIGVALVRRFGRDRGSAPDALGDPTREAVTGGDGPEDRN